MRILLSAFACSPIQGSEPGIGWNWAIEIARLGHHVTVLTQNQFRGPIASNPPAEDVRERLEFIFVDIPGGTRFHRMHPLFSYSHIYAWQVVARQVALKLHAHRAFDLVHHLTLGGIRLPTFMHSLKLPLILGPMGGGEGTPRALRRTYSPKSRVSDSIRNLSNALVRYDPLLRPAFSAAQLIALRTPENIPLIPKKYHDKIRIMQDIGVDSAVFTPETRPRSSPAAFLFAGRLLHWKGAHLALRAFAAAVKRQPGITLTLVGSGPDERRLRALGHALGLREQLHWVSSVLREKMPEIYRQHDVFLFPSLHDSGGTVVLEAAASGLPVVCLNTGGPGTLVEDSFGLRADVTDRNSDDEVVAELAHYIVELAGNLPTRQRMSHNARRWAETQTWASRVEQIYRNLP